MHHFTTILPEFRLPLSHSIPWLQGFSALLHSQFLSLPPWITVASWKFVITLSAPFSRWLENMLNTRVSHKSCKTLLSISLWREKWFLHWPSISSFFNQQFHSCEDLLSYGCSACLETLLKILAGGLLAIPVCVLTSSLLHIALGCIGNQ